MNEPTQPGVKHVIGPDGRRLTLADLPSPDTKRWVIRRKAEVVAAVRGGLLSLEEACSRYTLNPDEFLSWQYCIDRYGLAGLRTTRAQFHNKCRVAAEFELQGCCWLPMCLWTQRDDPALAPRTLRMRLAPDRRLVVLPST